MILPRRPALPRARGWGGKSAALTRLSYGLPRLARRQGGRWGSNPRPRIHGPVLWPVELQPPHACVFLHPSGGPAEALRLRTWWSRLHQGLGLRAPPAHRSTLTHLRSPPAGVARRAKRSPRPHGSARAGRWVIAPEGLWWIPPRRRLHPGPPALLVSVVLQPDAAAPPRLDRRGRGWQAHVSHESMGALLPARARRFAGVRGVPSAAGECGLRHRVQVQRASCMVAGKQKAAPPMSRRALLPRRGRPSAQGGCRRPNDHRDATPKGANSKRAPQPCQPPSWRGWTKSEGGRLKPLQQPHEVRLRGLQAPARTRWRCARRFAVRRAW